MSSGGGVFGGDVAELPLAAPSVKASPSASEVGKDEEPWSESLPSDRSPLLEEADAEES